MSRWVPARPEYYVQTGGMHENPFGVPHAEIARMALEMPPEVAAQVLFGKYVESSGLVFTSDLIHGMFVPEWPTVRSQFYVDQRLADSALLERYRRTGNWPMRFHTGIDYARKTDYTVITTLDALTVPAKVVYWKRLNRVPWETIYEEVGYARHLWGPHMMGDSTGPGGDSVFDALESRRFCHVHRKTPQIGYRCMENNEELEGCDPDDYLPLSCIVPFDFNGGRKYDLVEHLRNVLSVGYNSRAPKRGSYGWIRSPRLPQVNEELTLYAWEDKRLMTDCVFSLALAARSAWEDLIIPDGGSVGSVYGD